MIFLIFCNVCGYFRNYSIFAFKINCIAEENFIAEEIVSGLAIYL